MISFRDILRIETEPEHKTFEASYPYCELSRGQQGLQAYGDLLFCFQTIFSHFIEDSKEEHSFLAQIHQLFELIKPEVLTKNKNKLSHLNKLAHKYVFLATRMGAHFSLSSNPSLLTHPHIEFLQLETPESLWDSLSEVLQHLRPSEQNELITHVKNIFSELIQQGQDLQQLRARFD